MQVPLSQFTYLMLKPQANITTLAPAESDNEEVQLKQTAARLTIVLPTAANENQSNENNRT
jgi:hypothetical protein